MSTDVKQIKLSSDRSSEVFAPTRERVRFRTRLARKDKCLLQISRRKLNKLPSAIYGVLNRKVFRDKNKEQLYWAAFAFFYF